MLPVNPVSDNVPEYTLVYYFTQFKPDDFTHWSCATTEWVISEVLFKMIAATNSLGITVTQFNSFSGRGPRASPLTSKIVWH